MPIRPENRARYPADWKAISATVKARASWRCQGSPSFPDCRVRHHSVGYWDEGRWHALGHAEDKAKADAIRFTHEYTGYRITWVVLTVGHLDHQPENCDPLNLRAWCQRCHLHYDRDHHAETAYRTRREGKAAGDLFQS